MMKKKLALLMAAAISLTGLAGCGSSTSSSGTSSTGSSGTPAAGSVKTGLGVVSSVSSSAVKDGKGTAAATITAAAVTVDADGKIVKCVIDGLNANVEFDAAGKLLTPATTAFQSKNELGDGYNMKSQSSIGKEWNEQAAAFAEYVTGKTAAEVKGIALSNEGTPSDAELSASVTVHIGDFISVIEKAIANATVTGAEAADKLGLAIVSSANQSADAGEKAGLAQAYSFFAATTTGSDGKITSCVLDGLQNKVNFDTTGAITSDVKAEQKTKNELGDGYNMKSQSGIGKEWNEQAASFASYVTGKTADEVKGIALSDEGTPSDAELSSSVTIHVTDFITVVEKAVSSAK